MRKTVLIILFIVCITQLKAQTIKRIHTTLPELSSKQIFARINPDIFDDLPWLEPELKANKIEFTDGIFYFLLNGASCQLTRIENNLVEFKGYGNSSLMNKESSQHNIYFDKSTLKRKAEIKNRWVAENNVVQKPNDHNNKVKTEWKWKSVTDSILEIPSYDYYVFKLSDDKTIYLFEVKSLQGKTEYYLVNASYLYSTETDNIHYVLLDTDCNGTYTDAQDKILFLTWNPYLQESKYSMLRSIKENTWYDMKYLNSHYFLSFAYDNPKLTITNKNDEFTGNTKTGSLTLTKVPKGARLMVDGIEYPVKKGKNKFEIEYGYHRASISKSGLCDFDTVFNIDDKNADKEIRYVKPAPSGSLVIKNLHSDNYFITIKNASGSTVYHNTTEFNLPGRNYEIEIYIEGFFIKIPVEILLNKTMEIDFESQMKK